LVLSATLACCFAFLLSLAFLMLGAKLLGGTSFALISLLAYLLGIVAGGAIGIVAGLILARGLNRRLGLAR
jgi:phosphotransferase system  glucose/maltose/N-acetylglucosamine-specific IIC component